MPKFRVHAVLALFLIIALLAACGGGDDDKSDGASAVNLDTVTFLTNIPNPSFAGLYVAEKEGYFTGEKLTVRTIYTDEIPDLVGQDAIDLVSEGRAEFSQASADRLLTAREAGKPVVAIMAIFQRDPTAIISLAEKGIATPDDLVGKTIIYLDRGVMLNLFAQEVGLDLSQVTILEDLDVSAAMGMFMSGQADGVVSSVTEVGVGMQQMGLAMNTILFYDYGVAMYPNVVFTTEAFLQEKPEVVQRFVNAVLRGLQYAVDRPADVATWFEENFPDSVLVQQPGSLVPSLEAIVPLWHPQGSDVGMMSAATWQFIHDAMVEGGFLAATDVTQAYAMQFLEAYYEKN